MRIKLIEVQGYERPYQLRIPFRFGVKTATHGRQAVVRVRISLDGRPHAFGYSAEALGAKWFDKNLALSDTQNYHQLRKSLEIARDIYQASAPTTPFELYADSYDSHTAACAALDLNALIASFGQSMIDRAILDALCRALDVSVYSAMRDNLAGLCEHPVFPEAGNIDVASVFGQLAPQPSIDVRHTVGLADAILGSEVPVSTRVDDGLPESLEEVVSYYGNRFFKLKVSGDDAADLDRLVRVASVLDTIETPYFITLDGNEQYADAGAIAAFYRQVLATPVLRRLAGSILYVEQPINRQHALASPVDELATLVPVIIDESDGALSAFSEARELGYTGVSSKACKGLYKSIINHVRCRLWNERGTHRYFMSAEDLTCEPGIAIQQDLALVNLLGLTHVERNAHHFIDGFGDRPAHEAHAFLADHPDLYHQQGERVRLKLQHGTFAIGSLDCTGFGAAAVPDLEATEPMPAAEWPSSEDSA